jgi:hypothetical protein
LTVMSLVGSKRAIVVGISALLALASAGCSMHPLPEDVSRASTFDIVERIRCEVADGLREFENARDRDKATRIISATKMGFDFDFEIEEKNDAKSGKLEFQRPAAKGDRKSISLELSGGAERERKNTRSFRIVDNLGDLSKERQERCARTIKTANGLYPITGATGMAEVVRTYVKLEMLTDLSVEQDDPKLFDKGEVFSDEIKFTTRFTAGVSPKIELSTVAGQFRLSEASLFGSVTRDDIHSVTVALSRGAGDVDMVSTLVRNLGVTREDVVVRPFNGEPLIRPYRSVRRLIASQGTDAESRVVYELQRRRAAREDNRVVNRILLGTD